MPNAIILNSKNSQFQYNFFNGSFEIKDDSVMSVSQITIPYSWYNITSYLANNSNYNWTIYRFYHHNSKWFLYHFYIKYIYPMIFACI